MKIRKHSRILALALALVMVLPLISIPTFAADTENTDEVTHVTWSENFDTAPNAASVLVSGSTASSAKIERDALRVNFAAESTGKCYVMTDRNHAYEITNARYDDTSLVSGSVVIGGVTYEVSGPINNNDRGGEPNLDARLTPAKSGDAWIVTSERLDAWKGGLNIGGNGVIFDTPAIMYEDYSKAVYSADYFISTDAQEGAVIEGVFLTGISKRFEMFKLKVNKKDGYVTLDWHEDAGVKDPDAQPVTTPLGKWFTVKVEIDLTAGSAVLFLNGEYSMVITDTDASSGLDIKAASFMSIISRGDYAPSACTGYYLIDNVSLTTQNDLLYSLDFDQYEGVPVEEVSGGIYKNNFPLVGTFPTAVSFETENGDTYLRREFKADIQPGSEFDVDYYAYADYTKWAENANIAFYDKGVGRLVLKDGTGFDVTPQGEANVAKGYYGTFTYTDGKVYSLTSGEYAASAKFGDSNVDRSVALRIPVVSYSDYEEIFIGADYFIEPGSTGTAQSQFYGVCYYDSVSGSVKPFTWFSLYTVNLSTGAIDLGGSLPIGEWVNFGIKLNLVKGTVSVYVNGVEKVKDKQLTYNGTDANGNAAKLPFSQITLSAQPNTNKTSTFIVSKILKSADPLQGAMLVNNVKMGTPAIIEVGAPDSGDGGNDDGETTPTKKVFGNVDFENQTVGAAPNTSAIPALAVEGSKIVDLSGNKVWKIDFERPDGENKYNVDKNPKPQTLGASYDSVKSVVFETAYYFDPGANGRIQSQIYEASYGNGQAKYWNDLYEVDFSSATGVATLKHGSNSGIAGANTMKMGRWNTVSAVLDLETGALKVYLNGTLAVESVMIADSTTRAPMTNISFGGNQWIVGKVNKVNGAGTFYVDNVKMFEGDKPSETLLTNAAFGVWDSTKDYDLSNFGVPALPALCKLASVGNRTALRLEMGAFAGADGIALYNGNVVSEPVLAQEVALENYHPEEGYLVHNGVEYTIYQDSADTLSYVKHLTNDNTFAKYYLLPANLFEAAVGGENVGRSTVVAHSALSYKNTEYALLEADYFIEDGTTGAVESRFDEFQYAVNGQAQKGTALRLFEIDTVTGKLTAQSGTAVANVALDVNAWNSVKVVMNLVTGTYKVYVNGVLAGSYDCGYDNLILGSTNAEMWSLVSVKPHGDTNAPVYTGAVAVDNIRVTAWAVEETAAVNDAFFSDDAFRTYLAGAITQVDRASVRLGDTPGMRFATLVKDDRIEVLKSIFGAENVKMGTLISPDAYMERFITDYKAGYVTRADLDTVGQMLGKEAYLDVAFEGEYFGGHLNNGLESGKLMVGSILNIQQGNVSRDFAGIGYVEIVVDGTVYATYTMATMRCVKDVAGAAKEAYDNGEVAYSASALAVLEAYAAGNSAS